MKKNLNIAYLNGAEGIRRCSASSGSGNSENSNEEIQNRRFFIIKSFAPYNEDIFIPYEAHIDIDTNIIKYYKGENVYTYYYNFVEITKDEYDNASNMFVDNASLLDFSDDTIVLKANAGSYYVICCGEIYKDGINKNPYIEYTELIPTNGSFAGNAIFVVPMTNIQYYKRDMDADINDAMIGNEVASFSYSDGKIIKLRIG